MKQKLMVWTVLCLLLTLYGCRPHTYPHVLTQADSLCIAKPDSAVALLTSIGEEMANEPEATQMYYRLLCVKANDKAYIPHRSDSAILPVLHYYIEEDDRYHLPEAYYYSGRVYRDLGDAPQALDYFEKALEAFPEGDRSVLKEKVYSQMGTLFSYQGLKEEALKMYRHCLELNHATKDSVSLYYNLRDIGDTYRQLSNLDSALVYLKEAKEIVFLLHRKDLLSPSQSLLSSVYRGLKQYDSARASLHDALNNLKSYNQSATYSTAAVFHHTVKEMDSAFYYYNKLLDCGSVYGKRSAHAAFLQLAVQKMDFTQACNHLLSYHKYTDSIQKLTQTEAVQRTHSLYNYNLREKENLRLKTENQQRLFIIWGTVGGLIILALLFLTYRQYTRRRKEQLEEQIRKYRQIEEEIQQKLVSLESYKQLKEELEKRLQNITLPEQPEAVTRKMEQKLEWLNHILGQERIESEQEAEAQAQLFDSELYHALYSRASSARGEAYVFLEEWDNLKELILPAYPHFFSRLEYLHALNENELHVCILLKLKFRPADIARLLQLKPETISSIRKRLYRKVMGEPGTSEQWDKIIHSL